MTEEFKVVISPQVAKQLLLKENSIIDIKPNKKNSRETVFVFRNTEKFKYDLTEITNK